MHSAQIMMHVLAAHISGMHVQGCPLLACRPRWSISAPPPARRARADAAQVAFFMPGAAGAKAQQGGAFFQPGKVPPAEADAADGGSGGGGGEEAPDRFDGGDLEDPDGQHRRLHSEGKGSNGSLHWSSSRALMDAEAGTSSPPHTPKARGCPRPPQHPAAPPQPFVADSLIESSLVLGEPCQDPASVSRSSA